MAELSNWNGRAYQIYAKEIGTYASREDAKNTGVYLLFRNDIEHGDRVYIGETEQVSDRIKQHLKDNEYWNDCIIILSKDNRLNKAHVKYLENKFCNIAKEAGRYEVVNATIPTCSSIAAYDKAVRNEFMENTILLASVLGKKVFEYSVEREEEKQESAIMHINAGELLLHKQRRGGFGGHWTRAAQ